MTTDNNYTIKQHISMLYRGYKMLFSFSKSAMVWRTINAIFQQISPYFILYMSSYILNKLIEGKDFKYLMILVGVTVVGQFLLSLGENLLNRIAEKTDAIMWNIHDLYYMKKQNQIEYKYLDDADITMMKTRIQNASNWGGNGFMQLYWSWWHVLTSIVNILFSTALTVSLFKPITSTSINSFIEFANSIWANTLIVILIIVNVISTCILSNKSSDYLIMRQNELSKMYQNSNGYWKAALGCDSKIFGLGHIAYKHIKKANAPKFRSETATRLFFYGAIKTILLAILNCTLYLFVGAKAYWGIIGIGSIVLYHGTIHRFINAWETLSSRISKLFKNNKYMQDIFNFFDIPEESFKGHVPLSDGCHKCIEFKNVSFKYPNTKKFALKNISFSIHPGDKIAVVGCNGSGKTTLVKLLCRLYEPTSGEILLNGLPISQYKYEDYIAALAVVFQDFYIFSFSIVENISCSDVNNYDKVMHCIKEVHLEQCINNTKDGIHTLIGGYYDTKGIQLSGGESQKLSIARAMYKDSSIMIFDEPTASLDPLAEAELYSHFNNISHGKTTIYISHRLSSCRLSDKIAVFDDGNLVQFGTHEQLLTEKCGKYYELWNTQAQYYSTTP